MAPVLVGVLGEHTAPGKGPSSWDGWCLQEESLTSSSLPGTGLVCLHLRGDLSSPKNVLTVDSDTHPLGSIQDIPGICGSDPAKGSAGMGVRSKGSGRT